MHRNIIKNKQIKNKQTNKQAKQQPDVNDAIKGLYKWKERGNVRVK